MNLGFKEVDIRHAIASLFENGAAYNDENAVMSYLKVENRF